MKADLVNGRQEKDTPPERGKLIKQRALILEAEGKDAEEVIGKWDQRLHLLPCPPVLP